MVRETKYIKSMKILAQIQNGQPPVSEEGLLILLSKKGYIIRRPGRREWGSDCYDLTIKAEKTLEEYRKVEKIRGGSRPSAGHQGQ